VILECSNLWVHHNEIIVPSAGSVTSGFGIGNNSATVATCLVENNILDSSAVIAGANVVYVNGAGVTGNIIQNNLLKLSPQSGNYTASFGGASNNAFISNFYEITGLAADGDSLKEITDSIQFYMFNSNRTAIAAGTNPITARFYGTVDNPASPTNYERFNVDLATNANVVTLSTEAGGGGTVRDIRLVKGGNTFYTTETTTVSGLPSAGIKGRYRFVTDATATTFASIVAGSGANNVPVYDDGTNWRIG
jgi:hypothetical protein